MSKRNCAAHTWRVRVRVGVRREEGEGGCVCVRGEVNMYAALV